MYNKDFLLRQLQKFFEVIANIRANIDDGNLEEAKKKIDQNYNEELLDYFLETKLISGYDLEELKFHIHLLFLKLAMQKKHAALIDIDLKNKCVAAIKKILSIDSKLFDFELNNILNKINNDKY